MVATLVCRTCGAALPPDAFTVDHRNDTGRSRRCKACARSSYLKTRDLPHRTAICASCGARFASRGPQHRRCRACLLALVGLPADFDSRRDLAGVFGAGGMSLSQDRQAASEAQIRAVLDAMMAKAVLNGGRR